MNKNIINQIGCLTHLFSELNDRGIHRFTSIDELNNFRANYRTEIVNFRNQKIDELKKEISNNYKNLKEINEINSNLNNNVKTYNIIKIIYHYFLRKDYETRNNKLTESIKYKESHFEQIIHDKTNKFSAEIENVLKILDELNPVYFGAIGELKAVKELSKLNENYYIINDYKKSFNPPIFNRQDNDRISSIQADHIVVGPTGVFIIETKNWSKQSIANIDLFSPVKQLKRSSFALFCYLNGLIRDGRLISFELNWGDKKISIKNILLMVNASTKEQFQYVKIVNLNNLNNYITYGDVLLNKKEIEEVVKVLTK